MKPTIITVEGTYFDFTDPDSAQYTIRSIAHALSFVCRFGGHCRKFYSVAQHCVLLSYIVPEEYALEGLLHEAGEPFCGDMPSPLKMLLPEYKVIEKRVEASVLKRFGITDMPPCIKKADIVMLKTEQRDLMRRQNDDWELTRGAETLKQKIRPWPAWYARWRFLRRYKELAKKRFG
jgi:hypothetical protein